MLKGELGLASGQQPKGNYKLAWFNGLISADEVEFDPDVFILTKEKAKSIKTEQTPPRPEPEPQPGGETTLRISGKISPELWNRLGTKIIPKLRSGKDIKLGVDFSVIVSSNIAKNTITEIQQIIDDLDLSGKVNVTKED